MSATVIIFGGSGHLATSRLVPGLASSELLCHSEVIAVGRTALTTEEYHAKLTKPAKLADETWQHFLTHVRYFQADHASEQAYFELAKQLGEGDRILYMSVPPTTTRAMLGAIVDANIQQSQNGCVRIILEKPFGIDVLSAAELQAFLEYHLPPENIYPIDHFLAKETVNNVMAFRFGNAIFAPLWSNEFIREVQVTVAEQPGVEDRVATYADLGAARDLLQNHVMQVVALLAMEEPYDWSPAALAESKRAVLRQTYASPERTVLGQYRGEDRLAEKLGKTETYAASILHIQNDRWSNVPFAVRTGKRMPSSVADITIHFHQRKSALFGEESHANSLTFRIQPDESIFLSLGVKEPMKDAELAAVRMTFCYAGFFHNHLTDAYIGVLESVARGDRSIVVTPDVIAESWRIIDEMHTPDLEVHSYEQGSWGPAAADELMQRAGSEWTVTEGDVCNGVTLMKEDE